MKLSELKFEMALKDGQDHFCMHEDESDLLCRINSQEQLDIVRNQLMSKYGDVEISIHLDGFWSDVITIEDAKWREDHKAYCAKKQAWCDKYGCD